ncbi:MAG: methyltransferase domain-containing protein [Chloroflexi bacterium]|nr:methyltransferase domain-containing protein [Chloroflexota bacterium]MCC6896290.1 class I SAM-dependent methyltransferase [Anaerolineae bacterium]
MSEFIETVSTPHVRHDAVMHDIPCNLCGSQQNHPFCPENGLRLVECENCGLVYVSPRPDPNELYALYGETYFHNNQSGVVGYTNYLKDEPNIRKTFAGRLARLARFIRPGKLLDVGCAAGFFLDEARKQGWNVSGLDVSSFAVGYAAEHFGLDVRQGSLTELDFTDGSFDAVSMWDVIEHVPDPKAYIQRAAELLRSGGVIVLATPDVGSIPARLTGKRWVGYKLSEEHVYYFSIPTLSRMLNEAGFDVLDARHVGKFVTVRLFLDRLGMYSPIIARLLALAEKAFHLSERSVYVNPFDIVAITARKR